MNQIFGTLLKLRTNKNAPMKTARTKDLILFYYIIIGKFLLLALDYLEIPLYG